MLKKGESIIINVKDVKKFKVGMVHLIKTGNIYMLENMDHNALVNVVKGVWPNTDNVIPTTQKRCDTYVEIKPEYTKLKNEIFFETGIPFCAGLYQPLLWNGDNAKSTDGPVTFVVMPMRIERI